MVHVLRSCLEAYDTLPACPRAIWLKATAILRVLQSHCSLTWPGKVSYTQDVSPLWSPRQTALLRIKGSCLSHHRLKLRFIQQVKRTYGKLHALSCTYVFCFALLVTAHEAVFQDLNRSAYTAGFRGSTLSHPRGSTEDEASTTMLSKSSPTAALA